MRSSKLILILAVAVMAVGCGKDKNDGASGSTAPNFEPYIPPGAGPGLNPGVNWEYGATAPLIVTNESLRAFTGWTPNNPQEVKVNINLRRYDPAPGTSRPSYGGVVTVSFRDNGRVYEDQFSSLINESHWYGEGMVKTNEENNKYNVWITQNGQSYWHGFFQDRYGAVVVVIDDSNDRGDGEGPTRVSGSIWVKNFGLSYAPLSPTSCWFVSVGPYDCRAWKSGKSVNTDLGIYPDSGYQKLGDFENLEFQDAFNGFVN